MKEINNQIQVEPDHYKDLKYDSKERWISYWHQIDEILNLEPENVLEVGIGNGVVNRYLKNAGVSITTLDIDERLKPDKVGSVLNIPFTDNEFSVVACFEVLEHIPFKQFIDALKELKRVSNRYILLSMPDRSRVYKFFLHVPHKKDVKKLFRVPRINKLSHRFDGQHYWEIGKKNYPLKKVKDVIFEAELSLLKTFRVFEFKEHRFFLLEVK